MSLCNKDTMLFHIHFLRELLVFGVLINQICLLVWFGLINWFTDLAL